MIAAARARVERDGTPARFICADAQDLRVRAGRRRHDHVALRRDVLRRSGPRLRQPAPGGNGRRRAAVRRLASHGGEPVHDHGGACGGAAPAEPPAPPARRAGPVRVRRRPAGPRHPGGERLDGHRDPADRRRVHVPRDGARRLPDAARPGRPDPAGGGRATRARVVDAVRPAFDPYVHGSDVRFTAACWMVEARGGRR